MKEEKEQPDKETVIIKLTEEIYQQPSGRYEGENYRLTIKGETAFMWVNVEPAPDLIEYTIEVNPFPGSLPVACCATEWDTVNNKPFITPLRLIELSSVQRQSGKVRVKVRTSPGYIQFIAVGFIFTLEG